MNRSFQEILLIVPPTDPDEPPCRRDCDPTGNSDTAVCSPRSVVNAGSRLVQVTHGDRFHLSFPGEPST